MKDIEMYGPDEATEHMLDLRRKHVAAYNKAAAAIEAELIKLNQLREASKNAADVTVHLADGMEKHAEKLFRIDLDERLRNAYQKRIRLMARFARLNDVSLFPRICTVVCGPGQDYEVVRDTALQFIREKYPEYIKDKSCIDVTDNGRSCVYRYPVNDKDNCTVLYDDDIFAVDNFEEFGRSVDQLFADLMP